MVSLALFALPCNGVRLVGSFPSKESATKKAAEYFTACGVKGTTSHDKKTRINVLRKALLQGKQAEDPDAKLAFYPCNKTGECVQWVCSMEPECGLALRCKMTTEGRWLFTMAKPHTCSVIGKFKESTGTKQARYCNKALAAKVC